MTVFAREIKLTRITVFIQNGWQNSGQWRPEFWIIYAEFWMWRVQNSVKGRALVAEFWTICPEFADDVSRILSDVWQNSGRIYAEFCEKFRRILTRHQNSWAKIYMTTRWQTFVPPDKVLPPYRLWLLRFISFFEFVFWEFSHFY